MLTIGVDAHKQLLAAVAVDVAGREVAGREVENSPAGWEDLLSWALEHGDERQWGVEGSGGYGRGLAQHLVTGQEIVYEVNPRLTAAMRNRSRQRDKNDRKDGLAIARLVQQEGTGLPQVLPADATTSVALLTAERDELVADATRTRNQLHQQLHALDPTYKQRWRDLRNRATLEALAADPPVAPTPAEQVRVGSVCRMVARLLVLDGQLADVTTEIELQAKVHYQELTTLPGVSWLTAGTLAGMLGPGQRFETDAQVASYAGVAPLETSSAGTMRHRLNRTGNRRFNAVLHRIALTQSRQGEGRVYLQRRMAEGKTLREALRALKRFIARRIWRIWTTMFPPTTHPVPEL